jgi:8-amino-7-oxononanoate synthase
MKDLRPLLDQLQQDGLYRRRRITDSAQGAELTIDGRTLLNFCSNDYLGLAAHPALREAFIDAAQHWGVGSGAAHLINGHSRVHHELEEALAEFSGYPRALLFSTGYMANLGVAQALCGRGDAVFEDRLNHASLLDAGLLSGARLQRYAHNDTADLDARLAAREKGEKLVASDGVFSMDGDLAPLPDLVGSCKRQDAWLMIDDAHGIGVLGQEGRGSLEHHDLPTDAVPIYMATLGKALGSAGAFVAGSEDLIEYLIQKARTYIYTTASPPAVAAATLRSLQLVREEGWRREHLARLIQRFRSAAEQLGLPLMDSPTPIQPLLVGDSQRASTMSQGLLERGILVSAIRPPTVPQGTARLRITLSAAHEESQIDRLLDALHQII